MKKYLFALTFLLLLCFAPASAYAAPLTAQESQQEAQKLDFGITDGINQDKKTESTFDESRTISGSAQEGTAVSINVYTKSASGALNKKSEYGIEVGASGLFSQAIALSVGENVVKITAEKEGFESVYAEACIKRKSREIKTELENGVSIPGRGTTVKSPLFSIR